MNLPERSVAKTTQLIEAAHSRDEFNNLRELGNWHKLYISFKYEGRGYLTMCRNIKMLFNFDPPVTPEEVRAASLQFVRKISGFNKPSKANEAAFLAASDAVAAISTQLLYSLETNAPPRNREEEAEKAKARGVERFRASPPPAMQ
jgi:hypothetical protein